MEEMYHCKDELNAGKYIEKHRNKSTKRLCIEAAEAMEKNDIDSYTEYSIALMNRLKKLSDPEIEELEEYVRGKIEDGMECYKYVENVFAMKMIYGL